MTFTRVAVKPSCKETMDQFAIPLSLLALTASVLHAAWVGISLATGRWQPQLARGTMLAALGIVVLVLLSAGIHWAGGSSPAILPAALLAIVFVAAAPAVWFARRSNSQPMNRVACAACQAMLWAAAAANFHAAIDQPGGDDFDAVAHVAKVPVADAVVVTDRGRIFTVFQYDARGRDVPQDAAQALRGKLHRIAPPDASTNCHGWVFTGGRYAICAAAVAALLEDNGYHAVNSPRRGDVIVYRDDAGKILHSGRVRSVHDDGQVWVESKWGASGRYVHLAEHQCYSESFGFYHTSRPTHAAQLVRTTPRGDSQVASADDMATSKRG